MYSRLACKLSIATCNSDSARINVPAGGTPHEVEKCCKNIILRSGYFVFWKESEVHRDDHCPQLDREALAVAVVGF